MDIGIVGCGASGIYTAIKIKKDHPEYKVLILDRNDRPLKKLSITGNGKCNILNKNFKSGILGADTLLDQITYLDLISFFDSISFPVVDEEDLIYPLTKNAPSASVAIKEIAQTLGVQIISNEHILDYYLEDDNKICVKSKNHTYLFDKLVIATGSGAYPELGSDSSIIRTLEKRGYKTRPFSPALTQILVKDDFKILDGYRSDCLLSIFDQNKRLVFKEKGEVLFRKKALSGIVSFNASLFIVHSKNKNLSIELDLLPTYTNLNTDNINLLCPNKMIEFIKRRTHKNILSASDVFYCLKHFETKISYEFDNKYAQINDGGILLDNLNGNLESKIENNVYFVGELVNVQGYCGGYNLSWALASALIVAKAIGEKYDN